MDLASLLLFTEQSGGSDLLVSAGAPLMVRVRGELRRIADFDAGDAPPKPLSADEVRGLVFGLLTEEQRKELETHKELDLAVSVAGSARFRANVFYQDRGLGAAFRVIPARIRTCEELGLPEIVPRFASLKNGLVLFTGASGTGKSTSLAAVVDLINATHRGRIITIEEPIEFVHEPKLCMVNQRGVGPHTHSFAAALRSALRENPDVIMVGEMRDLETISLALTAAETGHLVLATLHTPSASRTIDRAINVFPPQEQQQIRAMLADTLQAVVSQVLVPRADARGLACAAEVLVATPAVRSLIRTSKTYELPNVIETGAQFGMQTFEQAFERLVSARVVSSETAESHLARLGGNGSGERRRAASSGPRRATGAAP